MSEKNKSNICSQCGTDKSITGFVKGRKTCKLCQRKACRNYKKRNRNLISTYNKQYKAGHKEEVKEYNAEYNVNNRKKIQTKHNEYIKIKIKNDPKFKMSCIIRSIIGSALRKLLKGEKKSAKTLELMGCTFEHFVKWFEFQFQYYDNDMTFENHGKVWHIDHIIPCNYFDLTKKEDQFKCFNWTNLQPLYAKDNLSKNSKIRTNDIVRNIINIVSFKKLNKEPYDFNELYKTKYLEILKTK